MSACIQIYLYNTTQLNIMTREYQKSESVDPESIWINLHDLESTPIQSMVPQYSYLNHYSVTIF